MLHAPKNSEGFTLFVSYPTLIVLHECIEEFIDSSGYFDINIDNVGEKIRLAALNLCNVGFRLQTLESVEEFLKAIKILDEWVKDIDTVHQNGLRSSEDIEKEGVLRIGLRTLRKELTSAKELFFIKFD